MSNIKEVYTNYITYLKLWGDDNDCKVTNENVQLQSNGSGKVYITKWDIDDILMPSPKELLQYTPEQVEDRVETDKLKSIKNNHMLISYDSKNKKLCVSLEGELYDIVLKRRIIGIIIEQDIDILLGEQQKMIHDCIKRYKDDKFSVKATLGRLEMVSKFIRGNRSCRRSASGI